MKPFRITGRNGWHAEVHRPDGRTTRKSFGKQKEALDWMTQEQARADATQAPAFGGPGQVRLGALLVEYAKLYTLVKGGTRPKSPASIITCAPPAPSEVR